MNNEKKLPDETVKDVAGGTSHNRLDYYDFKERILIQNCAHCLKRGKDCPFHDDLEEAYETLGNVVYCPYWSPTRDCTI